MRAFPSHDLFLNPHNLNSRLLQEIQSRLVWVALLIDDLFHPRVDHHLGAEDAGLMGAVKRCSFDADAMHCRLNDGILLGMHRPAELVAGAGGSGGEVMPSSSWPRFSWQKSQIIYLSPPSLWLW